MGEHARRDARGRGGPRRAQPGLTGHRRRSRRSSGRPASSSMRCTTCPNALILGQHPRLRDPRPLPVRVADRADQPRRDPVVADGGRDGAVRPRRDDQHDGPGRVRDLGRGRRRRRHHRRREHHAPAAPGAPDGSTRSTASIILDASLEVRQRDRLRDADRRRRGLAGLLHRAGCRARSSSRW